LTRRTGCGPRLARLRRLPEARGLRAAEAEGFESPRIDYEDAESIATGLAEVLEATGGTLDALFHNGAYAIPGAVEDLPTEALRQIFEANLFGWHDLTRHVIPVMRAQGHGRIVMLLGPGLRRPQVARGLCGDEARARRADGRAGSRWRTRP
jgi:NAD(P)-dependent dehydrogenase (short-subunit alcohol dehydrogenase family)